jgi:hypothetical protein
MSVKGLRSPAFLPDSGKIEVHDPSMMRYTRGRRCVKQKGCQKNIPAPKTQTCSGIIPTLFLLLYLLWYASSFFLALETLIILSVRALIAVLICRHTYRVQAWNVSAETRVL